MLVEPIFEDALRSHPASEVSAGYDDKLQMALVTLGPTSSS